MTPGDRAATAARSFTFDERFNMQHLMIDLETLGVAANAPVLAIGAVFFDPNTGATGAEFDAAIDVADAMQYGRISGETFKWWMQQSDDARRKAIRGQHPAKAVFGKFHEFCLKHGDGVQPWGNGASFDISILDYAFPRILEKPSPWKFWNVRDCRTIKALADGLVPYTGKMAGTAHAAIDDARHQVQWVSIYWQGLRGRIAPAPKPVDSDTLLDL